MYRLDWIEQLKLKLTAAPATGAVLTVSPVVWSLGFTSLLTDISTEMVNSALPVYLVLHLHLSPVQYGVIDGLYNGLAVALLSIAAGLIADRSGRHKEVAGFGYALSAGCARFCCSPRAVHGDGSRRSSASIASVRGFARRHAMR